MSDIIDNTEITLLDTVTSILGSSKSAKLAVGYFFLSGFKSITQELNKLQEIKLLIGNTTDRETIEQIVEGYKRLDLVNNKLDEMKHPSRSSIKDSIKKASQGIAASIELMDQTDEDQQLVMTLAEMIEKKKVKIRVYTRGILHAKAYIFDYGPVFNHRGQEVTRPEKGIAIAGSSNLSLAALTSNTELNVVIHGNENHRQITEWFDRLWDESHDFEESLIKELQRSWAIAKTTPYDVYMKTLYELVKDRLEGDGRSEILWEDELTSKLADFQKVAVKQAVRMIRDHNGCFVSDVVGLGKSYIGAAVIKHFVMTEDAKPLIICPAGLVDMWQRYVDIFSLNAKVLSMGLLREDNGDGLCETLTDDVYSSRDFVLIDESHNFRYPSTQRYKVLQNYLSSGDRRCCLLTATPRNKRAMDIYHQINLFYREPGTLPIDPPKLKEYFNLIERGERALPDVLSHILVRRTRNHVLKWYGYDENTDKPVDPANFGDYLDGRKRAYVKVGGKKQFFPRRILRTITYSIEDTYEGLYSKIRKLLGKPWRDIRNVSRNELTYARFGLAHYVKQDKKKEPRYQELNQAGANLSGLIRILAFKRLESSVFAFQETVKRMIRINETFLKALNINLIPAGEEAQQILYESDKYDLDDLMEKLETLCGKYDHHDFDTDCLKQHIEQDIRVLKEIESLIAPIGPKEDDKLLVLKKTLSEEPIVGGKCLIFTQYADTAKYLYDNLNPEGKRQDIEVVFSGSGSRNDIIGSFSPSSNPERYLDSREEIDLLIATDVLAEGLNLQDCDKIINYDLHWNPVRLIQRFGRIDRIGTEFEEIYGFNFLPETNIEANLHLEEKLKLRIQEIHETIGEDAAILSPTETLNEEAIYAVYSGDAKSLSWFEEDIQDKLVSLSEAEEMLRQLRQERPDEYKRISELRNGIRSGMEVEGFEGYFVMCASGNYKKLYLLDSGGKILTTDISRVLGFISCDSDTSTQSLNSNHNSIVATCISSFRNEVKDMKVKANYLAKKTKAQQYVFEELSRMFSDSDDEEFRDNLNVLREAFAGKLSVAVERLLKQIRREHVSGKVLFERLVEIYARYDLGIRSKDSVEAEGKETLPIVVASETLVNSKCYGRD